MNTTFFSPISIVFWKRATNKVVDYGLPLLDSSLTTRISHIDVNFIKESGYYYADLTFVGENLRLPIERSAVRFRNETSAMIILSTQSIECTYYKETSNYMFASQDINALLAFTEALLKLNQSDPKNIKRILRKCFRLFWSGNLNVIADENYNWAC